MARNTISGRSPKSRASGRRPRAIRLAGGLALLASLAVALAAPSAGASQFRAAPPPRPLSPALARVLAPAWRSGLFRPGFPLRAERKLPAVDVAMAPGSKWRREQTPFPAVPVGGGLNAVSCTNATTCMAVGSIAGGSFVAGGTAIAQVRHGARWRLQSVPSPAGATASRLWGVSCTAADACIAVGAYRSRNGNVRTLAEQWNGTSWHILATPAGPSYHALLSVSCTAPTACTAVGNDDGTTLAERWDGFSWSIQATPNQGIDSQLSGVSCTAANSCTAVGSWDGIPDDNPPTPAIAPLAEYWNGTNWSIQPALIASSTNSALLAVSCTSPQACTATGYDDEASRLTLAERWDGTSWNIQPTPNPAGTEINVLAAVSCTSAQACAAVGSDSTQTGADHAVAERWDGTSWSIQPVPNPGRILDTLSAISCTSARACTALGAYSSGEADSLTLAATWNGAKWDIQPTPNPIGSAESEFRSVSCRSARACTAVGNYLNTSNHFVTLAEVRDGTRWRIQATPRPRGATGGSPLTGVSCTSPRACIAVGYSVDRAGRDLTLAEARNGTRWRILATPRPAGATDSELSAVSCTSSRACAAAGYYVKNGSRKTLAEAWNGTRWHIQATPSPHAGAGSFGSVLTGVSCTSRRDCTAVGYSYTHRSAEQVMTMALAWNGTRWRLQATVTPAGGADVSGPVAVSCSAARRCTLTGSYYVGLEDNNTLAEGWDGTRWRIQATVNPGGIDVLAAVSCTSPRACTAVGDYQQDHYAHQFTAFAETWNGVRWSSQAIATGPSLFGVSCYSAGACTAVGGGAIFAEGHV